MTKADIIESLHATVKPLSKKEATDVVETVLEAMKASFSKGEKVKISGFGNFHVRTKKRRAGRNPQTGKPLEIPARRVLSFRPSKGLKDALNPHMHAPRNGRGA
jgi:integration host factor subunit alpha